MNSEKSSKAYRRLVRTLTSGNIWLYVLKLLSEKPMYGYEIIHNIKNSFKISVNTVTAYVILYKLANEKLIEVVEKNGKKYYEITAKGKSELKNGIDFLEHILDIIKP
ncbi:MAG: PadR family transcriptional regulator [Candidatus Methanomethylicia archaeon]